MRRPQAWCARGHRGGSLYPLTQKKPEASTLRSVRHEGVTQHWCPPLSGPNWFLKRLLLISNEHIAAQPLIFWHRANRKSLSACYSDPALIGGGGVTSAGWQIPTPPVEVALGSTKAGVLWERILCIQSQDTINTHIYNPNQYYRSRHVSTLACLILCVHVSVVFSSWCLLKAMWTGFISFWFYMNTSSKGKALLVVSELLCSLFPFFSCIFFSSFILRSHRSPRTNHPVCVTYGGMNGFWFWWATPSTWHCSDKPLYFVYQKDRTRGWWVFKDLRCLKK